MNALKSDWCAVNQRRLWLWVGAIAAFMLILFFLWFLVNSFEWLPFEFGPHGYLMATATIGLLIALWRSWVAYVQSRAALEQSKTAQSHLLNERYQKGVEMLGSEMLAVRLDGIYALERMAKNDPPAHHIQIMRVFSAVVRGWHIEDGPTSKQNYASFDNEQRMLPEDMRAILEVMGHRSSNQHEIELQEKYIIDLSGARLHGCVCCARDLAVPLNFSKINFSDANLSKVSFCAPAKFVGSYFMRTNLSGAGFIGADFSGVGENGFEGAKLFGADLRNAKGLTQEQINSAEIDPQRPPLLEGAVDPTTGKPLVVPSPPV